jgi:hypothetical protein
MRTKSINLRSIHHTKNMNSWRTHRFSAFSAFRHSVTVRREMSEDFTTWVHRQDNLVKIHVFCEQKFHLQAVTRALADALCKRSIQHASLSASDEPHRLPPLCSLVEYLVLSQRRMCLPPSFKATDVAVVVSVPTARGHLLYDSTGDGWGSLLLDMMDRCVVVVAYGAGDSDSVATATDALKHTWSGKSGNAWPAGWSVLPLTADASSASNSLLDLCLHHARDDHNRHTGLLRWSVGDPWLRREQTKTLRNALEDGLRVCQLDPSCVGEWQATTPRLKSWLGKLLGGVAVLDERVWICSGEFATCTWSTAHSWKRGLLRSTVAELRACGIVSAVVAPADHSNFDSVLLFVASWPKKMCLVAIEKYQRHVLASGSDCDAFVDQLCGFEHAPHDADAAD